MRTRLTASLAPLLVLLSAPAARAAKPDLPKPAMKALQSADAILGKSTDADRVKACSDAMPFLDIVVAKAPKYAYGMGLAGECAYLLEAYEKAATLLESYVALVPKKARQKDVADKVEKAELRLLKARQVLAERAEKAKAPPPPEPPKVVFVELPPPPPEPPAPPPPPPAPHREIAVRAGMAPSTGMLGVGGELRYGPVALGVGTGGYPLGASARGLYDLGPGSAYVEAHGVWVSSSPLVRRADTGWGFGATLGYDWRPLTLLSVKAGAGAAYLPGRGAGLVLELAVGPVLAF
jgi:hypothetical protein